MIDAGEGFGASRWLAASVAALFVHVGVASALLQNWNSKDDLLANAPVITLELAPVAAAPQSTPTDVPPAPVESKSQPELQSEPAPPEVQKEEPLPEPEKPIETAAVREPPAPVVTEEPVATEQPWELAVLPPRRPVVQKKPERKRQQASIASTPNSADRHADRAAAPAAGAGSQNPNAVSNWKSELVIRLERNKRYPAEAMSRGEQGVAHLAFSVDRRGGVHHARIVRSSGSRLLDAATLAILDRAAPLPAPPSELPGAQIPISVPIRYNMR
jgi:protein TonB